MSDVTPDERRAILRSTKEVEALRSNLDDLLRECWEYECREAMRLGPPPGWKPDPLDAPVPPKGDR